MFAVVALLVFSNSQEVLFRVSSLKDKIKESVSSIFFIHSVTSEKLQEKYGDSKRTNNKVRILVVPGHDEGTVGTRFADAKETDLNAVVAEEIFELLTQDGNFDPILLRNTFGYNTSFIEYLHSHREEINTFITDKKVEMTNLILEGLVDPHKGVMHNKAPGEVAFMLYGINKWANDLNVDIVIHIHFNDYPKKKSDSVGKYSGFAIYVPEEQYSNAKASRAIGEKVLSSISRFYPTSNLPAESGGLVPEQWLIAIGASNTLDAASLFLELGYIYESILHPASIREKTLNHLAWLTYDGLLDFFEGESDGRRTFEPYLRHEFSRDIGLDAKKDTDVWHLQTFLAYEGHYPPKGKTSRNCPLNGYFGPCTEMAVKTFQEINNIPATGFVGSATRSALNNN